VNNFVAPSSKRCRGVGRLRRRLTPEVEGAALPAFARGMTLRSFEN
jgi:hypothetical protein